MTEPQARATPSQHPLQASKSSEGLSGFVLRKQKKIKQKAVI